MDKRIIPDLSFLDHFIGLGTFTVIYLDEIKASREVISKFYMVAIEFRQIELFYNLACQINNADRFYILGTS